MSTAFIDLTKFRHTLPYASELFGLYQPILGWRSKRTARRLILGIEQADSHIFALTSQQFIPDAEFNVDGMPRAIRTARPESARVAAYHPSIRSLIADQVAVIVGQQDLKKRETWQMLDRKALDQLLGDVLKGDLPKVLGKLDVTVAERPKVVEAIVNRESIAAGVLNDLIERNEFEKLAWLFSPVTPTFSEKAYLGIREFLDPRLPQPAFDPLESFDPKADIHKVGLSPVGVIHLFRQYFFEFDTFLGPPVQHIWLSPGGTVELVKVSTRKTTIERVSEEVFESLRKSEQSLTSREELSEAVKQENESNSKFGASVTANENLIVTSAQETASVEFGSIQRQAREQTRKGMREQTGRLASEIKQSFKTTFRMITEVQDTTSKRYVIQNTTDQLVNYELRRKMRQVGVQVQDLGTRLCWQTYVDDPGRELGVAMLVHLASPPDFSSQGPLDEEKIPDEYEEKMIFSILTPPGDVTYVSWAPQFLKDVFVDPKPGFEFRGIAGPYRPISGGSMVLLIEPNRTKETRENNLTNYLRCVVKRLCILDPQYDRSNHATVLLPH